jgi:acid phosphatase (class A)
VVVFIMRKVTMRAVWVLVAICMVTSCSATQPVDAPTPATPTTSMVPEAAQGYLSSTAVPSSLALVPAPAAPGSIAMALDEEVSRSALAMYGTPRWELANRDAVLTFPAVAQTFSCALNLPVSGERTPKLIALLRRTLVDAGRATGEAKQHYRRTRPFAVNGKPICTPEREAALRADGSYPSGHGSIGWAFGLVLSQVSPDQTAALVARGRAFGGSRLVCNLHWQSDIRESRAVASAVVARLNAETAFRNDVAAARAEVAALRATGATAGKDCDAEARILKSWN